MKQYKIGIKYYEIGKYQEAYTIFRLLAKDEKAYGYNGLGICLTHGYCGSFDDKIEEDYHYSDDESLKHYQLASWCFEKAAEAGYSSAMCNLALSSSHYGRPCIYHILKEVSIGNNYCQIMLGIIYFYGWDSNVSKKESYEGNPVKAYELLEKPAKEGNKIAQSYLGRICYKEYVSAPHLHSFQDAFYWFKKAALQDDPIAQYYLGVCYEELDEKEAVYDDDGSYYLKYFEETEKWYKKSARNGFWKAQVVVGERYWRRGRRSVKNLNKAISWLTKATHHYYYAYERLADLYYEYKIYDEFERCTHICESLGHEYDAMFMKELELEFRDSLIW